MKKVFLDSSVLVAACASKKGASSLILGYCRVGKLQGYISLEVIGEARKNVGLKLNEIGKSRLKYFLRFANLFLVPPPLPEEIVKCEKYINEKDAPILAAAISSPTSFLITLGRKHFLNPKVKRFAKPLVIVTPGEFVLKLAKKEEK